MTTICLAIRPSAGVRRYSQVAVRSWRTAATLPSHFVFHHSVEHALRSSDRVPVVALESAIVTHGLPYDTNLEVARRCETAVREAGAVPATTALIDGKIHVGVSDEQLQRLSESAASGHRLATSTKTSRRDIPYILSSKKLGGTTVSATAMIASLAGIDFFATGGVGGVHRGGERTFDISSDLTTLSEFPINIFCSGVKSILSLPLTLEYLETQNVPVYSFAPKGRFPAFYTSQSDLYVTPVEDDASAADIIWTTKNVIAQQPGSLFAVPIPRQYEEEGLAIQKQVEQAVKESVEKGVDQRGKQVTPWLLQRVSELSKGNSLKSNEALVVNNAATAARIAVKYRQLEQHRENDAIPSTQHDDVMKESSRSQTLAVVVLGCAALDVTSSTDRPLPGATSEGVVQFSLGGVGRNVAEAAHYALPEGDGQVRLVAPLFDDAPGSLIRHKMEQRGLVTQGLFLPSSVSSSDYSSPVASLLLDATTSDLLSGVTTMSLVEKALTRTQVLEATQMGAQVIGFDSNLCSQAMEALLECKGPEDAHAFSIVFEPTTAAKGIRVIDAIASIQRTVGPSQRPLIDVATPNIIELQAMAKAAREVGLSPAGQSIQTSHIADATLRTAAELGAPLLPYIGLIFVTIGSRGVLCLFRDGSGKSIAYHEPTQRILEAQDVKSTTGAGDCFAGAVIAALASESLRDIKGSATSRAWSLERVLRLAGTGNAASLRSLISHEAVPRPRPDDGPRWRLE